MKVGDINLIVDDMPKDYIEALGLDTKADIQEEVVLEIA